MKCLNCDKEYRSISRHWSMSDCKPPELTQVQEQVIEGVLMSDGWIDKSSKPRICIAVKSRKFLDWLDKKLGWLSNGVTSKKSRPDLHILRTKRCNKLQKYNEWYKEKGKKWVVDELKPLTAKILYAGDGSLYTHSPTPYCRIGAKNQKKFKKETIKLFEEAGFEVNWNSHNIVFSCSESKKFIDWMGEPAPGYEYKWSIP